VELITQGVVTALPWVERLEKALKGAVFALLLVTVKASLLTIVVLLILHQKKLLYRVPQTVTYST
jgi:NADH:ubiquinone oxidoreductase subunit K